jgi:hypothetical protein
LTGPSGWPPNASSPADDADQWEAVADESQAWVSEHCCPLLYRYRSVREKEGALAARTSWLGEALINATNTLAVETGRR